MLLLRCEEGYEQLGAGAIPWGDAEAIRAAGGEFVKKSPSRQVVSMETGPGGEGGRVFCKRYVARGLGDTLSVALAGSRARREFAVGRKALEAGLPVARPVAMGEIHRWGIARVSVVVTEAVPHDGTLDAMWTACESNARRRELVRAAGAFIREMHDRGLYHDDLAAPHILTRKSEDGWEFTLIDLLNCRVGRLGRYAKAKMLYQLCRSLSRVGLGPGGRLRLLRAYLGAGGGGGAGGEESGDRAVRKWWKRMECARVLKRGYYGRSRRYLPRVEPITGGR